MENGGSIPIEERAPEEVLEFGGQRIAPEGVSALNPAFDVTPAEYVTAIVTEAGTAQFVRHYGRPYLCRRVDDGDEHIEARRNRRFEALPFEVKDWSSLRAEQSALVCRRQEAGAPVMRATLGTFRIAHHNVARQILIFAA